MLFPLDYVNVIYKCFDQSYLKLTSPDHISSNYQLLFLIFKASYHDHCSFQNISFSLMESQWKIFGKKSS